VELEPRFADHIEAQLAVGHIGAECESDTNPNEPFVLLERIHVDLHHVSGGSDGCGERGNFQEEGKLADNEVAFIRF
jgi:hypothetical protein